MRHRYGIVPAVLLGGAWCSAGPYGFSTTKRTQAETKLL